VNGSEPVAPVGESLDACRATVRACDEFEKAWRAGAPPTINQIVLGFDPSLQPFIAAELTALAAELESSTRPEKRTSSESVEARQLLLGLLGHEHGLIDGRLLVAGIQAWIENKSEPLGAVLVSQRAITPGRLTAMEELAAAHLARHGQSSRLGLRALRPIGSLRQELEELPDPVLRAELEQVDWNGLVGAPESSGEDRGSRYQILEPLGQGGMGKVFVALDQNLQRKVALKEIRDNAADDPRSRARFLAEAELTSKLEHPGIIPVYSSGSRADGRPYYAMRLIQGEQTGSLQAAIHAHHSHASTDPAARDLAFRGLLRRVRDVCHTIEYAHSQSVIHRDLKPSNILLGPYGETLVVDWGLAKVLGTEESPENPGSGLLFRELGKSVESTLDGKAIGTPEYAAPEQVSGEPASVGPASDIYALGAMLYTLLTGGSPFTRRGTDAETLKRNILEGNFIPPRKIQPRVDHALEAICLKAMRTRPEDRYPSARAMGEDLDRYLAGEPVNAYREPLPLRFRRWAARHRTLTVSTFVALLAAVLGLGAISAVQLQASKQLEQKNNLLIEQQKATDIQREEAVTQRKAANAQRVIAEQRETLAIDAVKQFRDAVAKNAALKNSPALASLRAGLLQKPQAFFQNLQDEFERQNDKRPESLVRLAEACAELSNLAGELGDYPKSLSLLERAAALYGQALDGADKPPIAWLMAQADLEQQRGVLYRNQGANNKALSAFEQAVKTHQKLLDAYPDNLDLQAQAGSAYNRLASMLGRLGRHTEAQEDMERALAMRTQVNQARPGRKDDLLALAGSHNNLGLLLKGRGKVQQGLAEIERALDIYRELAEKYPQDPEVLSWQENSIFYRGTILCQAGRTQEGISEMEKAIALRLKLTNDQASITEYQAQLAQNYSEISDQYKKEGQLQSALTARLRGIELASALVKSSPGTPRFLLLLMEQHHEHGHLLSLLGQSREAVQAYERALAFQEQVMAVSPATPLLLAKRIEFLTHLIDLHTEAGELKPAQLRLQQAVATRKELPAQGKFPGSEIVPTLRQYLEKLELISGELGDEKAAANARKQLSELRGAD